MTKDRTDTVLVVPAQRAAHRLCEGHLRPPAKSTLDKRGVKYHCRNIVRAGWYYRSSGHYREKMETARLHAFLFQMRKRLKNTEFLVVCDSSFDSFFYVCRYLPVEVLYCTGGVQEDSVDIVRSTRSNLYILI